MWLPEQIDLGKVNELPPAMTARSMNRPNLWAWSAVVAGGITSS
jgi:hypothetical protein